MTIICGTSLHEQIPSKEFPSVSEILTTGADNEAICPARGAEILNSFPLNRVKLSGEPMLP